MRISPKKRILIFISLFLILISTAYAKSNIKISKDKQIDEKVPFFQKLIKRVNRGIQMEIGFGFTHKEKDKANFFEKDLISNCNAGNYKQCYFYGWSKELGLLIKNYQIAKEYYEKACNGGYEMGCEALKKLDKKPYKTRYDESFTYKGQIDKDRRRPYIKDPYIWVYTSSFAKRFDMPKRYINDNLKGAEALAFTIELGSYISCSYTSENEEICGEYGSSPTTIMDIFVSKSAKLPWNTETRYFTNTYLKSSHTYLKGGKKSENYLKRWANVRDDKLELGMFAYSYDDKNYLRKQLHSLRSFDRDMYDGLDYLRTYIGFEDREDIKVYFYKKNINKEKKKWKKINPSKNITITHTIEIPNEFMIRIQKYIKNSRLKDSYIQKKRDLAKKIYNAN